MLVTRLCMSYLIYHRGKVYSYERSSNGREGGGASEYQKVRPFPVVKKRVKLVKMAKKDKLGAQWPKAGKELLEPATKYFSKTVSETFQRKVNIPM